MRWNPNNNIVTLSCSRQRRKGKDCRDGYEFFFQRNNIGWNPFMGSRATLVDMTQVQQPLKRGRLTIKSFVACLLWRGVTDWNDLPFHQGLLDGTPQITSTHTQSKVQNRRHSGKGEVYLEMGKDGQRKEEIQWQKSTSPGGKCTRSQWTQQ